MSKRRRSRNRAPRQNVSRARQRQPMTQSVAAPDKATSQPDAQPDGGVDFSSEYRYVLSDLKRLGLLAAAMFATLIILALAIG
jgi:hypothetical protein